MNPGFDPASRLVAGRYRLGERLGSGAMGIVWQAHDERLHRTVAVKQLLLPPGLPAEQAEQARQRALREGRIAARLQHPGAVTVHDVVTDEGDPWLVMEYLPAKSLATLLAEQGTLAPLRIAAVGAQAAAALTAAHAAGVVHRDVKPGNVLLGEQDLVKITDFGISRAIGDVTVTATGILSGTPAYLAPELARGAEPKPASDVYALGATLYTAVEGEPPCGRSDNPLALLHAVAAGRINPPRQAGPLTAVLLALLRAEPAQRPSMDNAREALATVAAGRALPGTLLRPPVPGSTEPTEPRQPEPRQPAPPATARPGTTPPAADHQQAGHQHGNQPSDERQPGEHPRVAPPWQPTSTAGHPPGKPVPPTPPERTVSPSPDGSPTRQVLLAVLAIAAAIAVGIGVASLFLLIG